MCETVTEFVMCGTVTEFVMSETVKEFVMCEIVTEFVMCETVTEFEATFRLYLRFKRLNYGVFYAYSRICLHKRICKTLH
jgi:hypothetical protein